MPQAVGKADVHAVRSQEDAPSRRVRDLAHRPHARRRGQTDRGKEFAKTRGKGKKRGLNGTQPGKERTAAPASR